MKGGENGRKLAYTSKEIWNRELIWKIHLRHLKKNPPPHKALTGMSIIDIT